MTTVVNDKSDLIVPRSVRRLAGIKSGTRVEFTVTGGVINIVPAASVEPAEYTPNQRLHIDAQLAVVQNGPFHGPFDSARDMAAHIEETLKQRAVARKISKRGR